MSVNEGKLLRFLLVEDDESHAQILLRNLKRERIRNSIDWVKDGAEALDYLFQRGSFSSSPRPDVILLDLKLPKKDGHEVLEEVKRHTSLREIPVVVLTTSAAESDMRRAYQTYVNSYLVKPIDIEAFRQLVADLSLYWGIWNEGLPPKSRTSG